MAPTTIKQWLAIAKVRDPTFAKIITQYNLEEKFRDCWNTALQREMYVPIEVYNSLEDEIENLKYDIYMLEMDNELLTYDLDIVEDRLNKYLHD